MDDIAVLPLPSSGRGAQAAPVTDVAKETLIYKKHTSTASLE
jgi:hypothetical protein